MIQTNHLSSVGVGTYRMHVEDSVHYDALVTAVEQGYNLIDTATNYAGGKSEQLIGKFLQHHPQYSKQLFIVSKVGYVPSQVQRTQTFADFWSNSVEEKALIEEDFEYSLDPNFIRYQLDKSLKNVHRDYIDVYLLHNPERYLQSQNLSSPTQVYESIATAFRCLEEQVQAGKIRYYGLSSNCMFQPNEARSLDLAKILEIATSIAVDHHFKFIQFPFNFKETKALEPNYGSLSLLELAKKNGLITIGNRPLNMNEQGYEFRLVTHEAAVTQLNAKQAEEDWKTFYQKVDEQIQHLTNGENQASDFDPMLTLEQHYKDFQSKGAVDHFFETNLLPFIETVFEENNPSVELLLKSVWEHTVLFALKKQTEKTQTFLANLEEEGVELKENSVTTACHAYLDDTLLDHVLVGLRRPAYVLDLNGKFTSKVLV